METSLEQQMRDIAQQVSIENSTADQFAVSQTPFHTHNGSDSQYVSFPNLTNRSRFIMCRILSATTAAAVANTIGGNFVLPFAGNFTTVGAFVDTAGTTGTMVINVLLNGVTIFFSTAGLSVTSGATASNSVTNFMIPNFKLNDILTFNVTTVHTTPALGLTMALRVTETSQ